MLNACKFSLIFVLLFVAGLASAQEKKLALVRKVQGLELIPPGLARQLQAITLQVITKRPDYELLISGADTPTGSVIEIVAVESEVSKGKDGYRIEARLLDLRTKKLITKASREEIREEDLVRLFQGALESLFLPDKEIEKAPVEKEIKPKTTTIVPKIKRDLPITTQINQPDPPQMDFKQRVRDLQKAADVAIIKKIAEKEKAAEAARAANRPPTSPPSSARPMAKAESVVEPKFEKPPIEKIFPKTYNIFVGHDSRQIETEFYLGTSTKGQLLTIKADGDYPFSILDGRLGASFDFAYSRPLSVPVEIPALHQAGLFASWLTPRWNTSVGMIQDTSFFVNLPVAGGSLQPQLITTRWLRAKTSFSFDLFGLWKFNLSYAVPNTVESSYSPLKNAKSWQGTSTQFGITPPLSFMGFETHFAIEKNTLTTSGEVPFTLNESRVALSFRRSL